jgi:hypothetical protein
MNETNSSGNLQSQPVFLRLPSDPKGPLWPGLPLKYSQLRPLISPGPWNNNTPPIRAYDLRKPRAKRGIPLIEHIDVIQWLNAQFQRTDPAFPPIPLPYIKAPEILIVPSKRRPQCPFTLLKRTSLFELSLPDSEYGQTRIYVTRLRIPGREVGTIAMETQSVLRFIRSFPPPQYKITPCKYTDPEDPLTP